MSYRIPIPSPDGPRTLDVVDPFSSMVQRFLRREGLSAYEPETAATLLALFDVLGPGLRFWDVGANVGLYSHLCAALFEPAEVVAFEPTPDTAEIARAIARANHLDVDVVEVAISDRSGWATLYLSETSDASNSLVEGFKPAAGTVDVATVGLDDVLRERAGRAPDVLKLDVETHEVRVLEGAAEMLREARPYVVVEVLRRRGHDYGPDIERTLEGLGYVYYPLQIPSDWRPRTEVRGSGRIERDWLLAPEPLPDDFVDTFEAWRGRLAQCGRELNSRPPIRGAARAAWQRGGWREVVGSARRFVNDSVGRGRDAERQS